MADKKAKLQRRNILFGLYGDEEILLDAVGTAKERHLDIMDVYTPFPVHGLDKVLGLAESRLHYAGFIFGSIGCMFAFGFMTWVFTNNWPIIVGGKPYFAAPAFIPVTFEVTVLSAAVGMTVTYYLINGLGPGVTNPYLHPRITDDKFCIAFDVTDASASEITAINEFFGDTETEEVHTKEIMIPRHKVITAHAH